MQAALQESDAARDQYDSVMEPIGKKKPKSKESKD